MTYFLFMILILHKCQYLMKYWTEFSHIQSEWSANGVVSNLCHFFFSQIDKLKNGCLCLSTKNSENIKQTVSHEISNRFCQNVSYWCFPRVPNVKAQSRCDIAFRGILIIFIKSTYSYLTNMTWSSLIYTQVCLLWTPCLLAHMSNFHEKKKKRKNAMSKLLLSLPLLLLSRPLL